MKKVIIDKVDVSNCEFLCKEQNNKCLQYQNNTKCNEVPFCLYKESHDFIKYVFDLEKRNQSLRILIDKFMEEHNQFKYYINQIMEEELKTHDMDYEDYLNSSGVEISNIINLCEDALHDIESKEQC